VASGASPARDCGSERRSGKLRGAARSARSETIPLAAPARANDFGGRKLQSFWLLCPSAPTGKRSTTEFKSGGDGWHDWNSWRKVPIQRKLLQGRWRGRRSQFSLPTSLIIQDSLRPPKRRPTHDCGLFEWGPLIPPLFPIVVKSLKTPATAFSHRSTAPQTL
jgi:hypothetical protein